MKIKAISLFMAAALVLNSITAVLGAKTCSPQADEYTVTSNVNMEMSRIEMGDTVNIAVEMTDNNIKTDEIPSADNIEITGVEGSFGNNDADSVEITSDKGKNIEYKINFKNVSYSGAGNTLSFKVKYKNLNLTSDKITLNINECSERDNSTDNPSLNSRQPYIEIGRNTIQKPVNANEEFTLYLTVKNRGGVKIKRPVMTISLPDSINSLEGMGNIQIPDIEAGTSRNITLKLKGADYIQSASEAIDITLSYYYESGAEGITSGSYTDRIFVPMTATKKTAAPVIEITAGSIKSSIKSDEEFTYPVTVKNTSNTTVYMPRLAITMPEELILMQSIKPLGIKKLEPNQSVSTELKVKAKKQITSSTQDITAELKYSYISENESVDGEESVKLPVVTVPNDDEGDEPLLHIVTDSIENPLKGNEKFTIKVTINNIGTSDLTAGVLNSETSEGIILTDKSASINIGSIKAGSSKVINIKGRTSDSISATTQTITGELKYKYKSSKGTASGTETIKAVIPTEIQNNEKAKSVTPNIIVNSYNYGGVPIANGNKFNFNVSFKNTSKKTPVENIVMTIGTEEGVSITSASNTYYYESLKALGVKGETVEMQVLPAAESGSVKLTIDFKYEYVENGERNQVTSSQNVSIPVYKPDKLEITLDPLPTATVGLEQSVNLNYVNKGKGEISNVKAEITGDVTALTSVQNLGNFEPGKSGTITFVVVPEMVGEVNFTVKVSYEDANLEQKTLEFPCTMTVEEYVEDNMGMEEEMPEEETSSHKGIIIAGVIGGIIFIIIIVIIIRKIRKKRKDNRVKVNWEDEDENIGLD